MQKLWSMGLDWDDEVPPHVRSIWEEYISDLDLLNKLDVPRKITTDAKSENDLIAVCDASLNTYGAIVYLRSTSKLGQVSINLIYSKRE